MPPVQLEVATSWQSWDPQFTAMIRLPESVSKEDKLQRLEDIIDALDIRKCCNTVIGDIFVHGLSGGEKKRASIASELLIDPDILLLVGKACSYAAALAYNVEAAIRLGLRDNACTSSLCTWNDMSRKKAQPARLTEIDFKRPKYGEDIRPNPDAPGTASMTAEAKIDFDSL
ncbi:uncharacterized protein LOC128231246 isoform X1 [Mya arenaria]|uniref:uncharacterized protein LOC128231246 isoform X1 n=1 Tax=Mya arenaria TaxID=6604 RepID=UPI0022E59EE5|nr:uncharacterized protein LOC128231246 isoform X1 [Mya arenaria]